jgi:hypothetical protein
MVIHRTVKSPDQSASSIVRRNPSLVPPDMAWVAFIAIGSVQPASFPFMERNHLTVLAPKNILMVPSRSLWFPWKRSKVRRRCAVMRCCFVC